jgi:8-oxo-dGTP diphosphatase
MASQAFPDRPVVAVGAVVLKGRSVLLVKRRKPPNEGLWAIPGGSVELGETLQEAAEREILEETGVSIRAREPVYIFDVVDRDDQGGVRYHYVIADLIADYLKGEPVPADDALEARWIGPGDLDELAVSATTLDLLRRTPGFGAGS